jgi:hypothetical protein
LKAFVILVAMIVEPSAALAADRCAAGDLAIKACANQYLIDSNFLLRESLSDPGGAKTKEAIDSCQLDCNTHSDDFESKCGSFRSQ